MSLFDVSGAAPHLIDQVHIGKALGATRRSSAAHHAFSALARATVRPSSPSPRRSYDGTPLPYDSSWYPWDYSGLLQFEVRGTTPADARLLQARTLVTERNITANTHTVRTTSAAGRDAAVPCSSRKPASTWQR
jgi:hypothetical protein